MTIYAGESVRISTDLKDYDGNLLTNADVVGVTIEIYLSGASILASTSMTWDASLQKWTYNWDTTGRVVGNYLVKCIAAGVDFEAWEYAIVRLNRNRV